MVAQTEHAGTLEVGSAPRQPGRPNLAGVKNEVVELLQPRFI